MNHQETGILIHVFPTKQVSERFKIREFVIAINHTTQYPQEIKLQFTQDKCDIIDAYQKGVEVIVDFNLKGKQYQDRQGETQWITTLEAWKIQPVKYAAEKLPTYEYNR